MFAYALVFGNAAEASAKFKRWLKAADPTGALCPPVVERAYPWGWIGVAGRGHLIVRQGGSGSLLAVYGAVLDAEFRQELETSPDWEKLADRLPEITGQFVFACVRDHPNRPVVAGMDNLAMKAMFWSERNGCSAISNISALCGLMVGRYEQNADYVRDLIIKDAVLPWQSLLQDVHRVMRGTYLVLAEGMVRTEVSRYRDLHLSTADRPTALESMRKAARSLLGYKQQHLIGLSGGVDARIMQALLMVEDIPFEAGTHMMPCLDGEIARELAATAGVAHWSIGRTRGDILAPMAKYFTYLPWSEGAYSWSVIDQPYSVHDFAASRGMIHLGGLGGETARSYWDMASARFETPEELLIARFFQPLVDCMYPNREIAQQSQQDWLTLAQVKGTVDRFVSMQMAFHDARLRGTLALRAYCSPCDYAWPLSNPEFYAYSWRMPRSERQAGIIFDDFIGEWAPKLLTIRWHKGNSGIYIKGGLHGMKDAAKEYVKRWQIVHVLRGKMQRSSPRWSWRRVRSLFLEEFFRDQEAREWLHVNFGPVGIEMASTLSQSYISQAEKMVNLYWSWRFLRALNEDAKPQPFWESLWLQKVMTKIAQIEG